MYTETDTTGGEEDGSGVELRNGREKDRERIARRRRETGRGQNDDGKTERRGRGRLKRGRREGIV